jgi:hypothetical protein
MERYAITDDEAPMFNVCLRESLPIAYEAMKPLTHGINEAFSIKTGTQLKQIDGLAGLVGITAAADYVVIRTVDNGAYNPNDVTLVDSSLQSTIEQGALSEYYARVVYKELTELSTAQFGEHLNTLTRRIIPLRKKTSL